MIEKILAFFHNLFSLHNLFILEVSLIALAALAIWVYLVYLGWSFLQKRQQLSRQVRLENRGNIPTRFYLQIELGKIKNAVITRWKMENRPIKPRKIERVNFIEETESQVKKPAKQVKTERKTGNPKAAVMGKYRFFRTIVSLIANISSALAALLPGGAKKPFKDLADSLRQGQQEADRVVAQPKKIADAGERLKSNVNQLGSRTGKTKTSVEQEKPAVEEKQYRRVVNICQVIETPAFTPAESSTFRVMIRPRNPFRKITGTYTIASQQVESPDFPAYEALQPATLSEDFIIKGAAFGHLILYFSFCLVVLAFNLWWSLACYQWLSKLLNYL